MILTSYASERLSTSRCDLGNQCFQSRGMSKVGVEWIEERIQGEDVERACRDNVFMMDGYKATGNWS